MSFPFSIVIPAKAGIQMPSFTGEVIFAQIRKLTLDFGPQFYWGFPFSQIYRGLLAIL